MSTSTASSAIIAEHLLVTDWPSASSLVVGSGELHRGAFAKRASLYLVRLLPQLRLPLSNTIDRVTEIHGQLHTNVRVFPSEEVFFWCNIEMGWWTNLGKDDRERSKAFDMLSQARMDWAVFARIALGRALRDVRAYVLNPVRAKLLPPKKKRVIETTASSSSAAKEIEKTSPDEF
ncbi:unnamed protein product [Cylicocyclus nassatus]|uniref:Uncharacterized protein n=1 Tax=Cylicocyclus nassatus TaxID=53992 RepID=A0AA36GKX0_CYLNA|nr:unnamed protein product [Cylicocyclus nassatus]